LSGGNIYHHRLQTSHIRLNRYRMHTRRFPLVGLSRSDSLWHLGKGALVPLHAPGKRITLPTHPLRPSRSVRTASVTVHAVGTPALSLISPIPSTRARPRRRLMCTLSSATDCSTVVIH